MPQNRMNIFSRPSTYKILLKLLIHIILAEKCKSLHLVLWQMHCKSPQYFPHSHHYMQDFYSDLFLLERQSLIEWSRHIVIEFEDRKLFGEIHSQHRFPNLVVPKHWKYVSNDEYRFEDAASFWAEVAIPCEVYRS